MRMNAIRGIVSLSLRGYRTNRGSRESSRRLKAPRQIEMVQPGMAVENIFDEEKDPEDLDEYASDFSNVAEYDKMHEREMEIEKSKLMTQIVKRKYFKNEEPPMVTWAEKEQIRRLHSHDPDEWTADRLSESFPASKDAILKILRSKWSAKSVKVVQKYDENVKKNWHLFKSKKLNVEPKLEAHLLKFKNRNINVLDPDTIAKKIISPKPEFSKPQSQLFTNIIQNYVEDVNSAGSEKEDDQLPDENKTSFIKKLQDPKSKSFNEIISNDDYSAVENTINQELTGTEKLAIERKYPRKTPFTFHQFLETHTESICEDKINPIDRVIVDELKQQTTENYKSKSLIFQSASPVAAWKQQNAPATNTDKQISETFNNIMSIDASEKSVESFDSEKMSDELSKISSESSVKPQLDNILEGSLETGIIARHKTETSQQDDYPELIKIPRQKYKRGLTYKVEDRYYDDDGEFLYRVPGLKA